MKHISAVVRDRSDPTPKDQEARATVPDLAQIMTLHRHQDGYISFGVSDPDHFRPVVSIRADELERYFPEFREQLLKDSHVSVNAGYQLRRQGRDGAAHGYPMHRSDRLRYLCAAYADIDFYNLGATFGQALGRIVDMQEAGALPEASMIVKSGRGMWVLYLLHDPKDPTRAPGAFPEKLDLYHRLQRAIVARLAAIGADPCGTDATRHLRVPGSFHSASETHVRWWIQGCGPTAHSYTLAELCAAFGVEARVYHPKERAAVSPEISAVKKRGWVALNARRLRDFNLLRSMRGGFSKGCRSMAALVYAHLLRTNGIPLVDAQGMVNDLGAECHPRMTPSACRDAVKAGYGRKSVKIYDQTISDWLQIDPGEATGLEGLPMATRHKDANPGPPEPTRWENRALAIAARRQKITETIATLGRVPTVRNMVGLLADAGLSGGRQTVQDDYETLGIQSSRSRCARVAEKSRQLTLSER
jgi:hypothetical protein